MLTLLVLGALLAKRLDRPLRLVATGGLSLGTADQLLQVLAEAGVELRSTDVSVIDNRTSMGMRPVLPLHPDDVVVVSDWTDARLAGGLQRGRPFVYLIQDFEPNFYGAGDRYVLAEATYRSGGHVKVFNTSVLREFFMERGYPGAVDGLVFEPAVGTRPQQGAAEGVSTGRQGRKLFLYGRPQVERNFFYVALAAIDRAVTAEHAAEGWSFWTGGDATLPDLSLRSGAVLRSLGKLPLAEYHAFASSVEVAVTPMLAPHPNYPTLEFAARGSRVVTTSFATKTDLTRYSPAITCCEPTIEGLAGAIATALGDPPLDGSKASLPRSWPDAMAGALDALMPSFV